jgi:hypothetical protein
VRLGAVLRMPAVGWCDHRTFACPCDEGPAVVVLAVVVVLAERVAFVESGVAGLCVGDAMVDLGPGAGAAFDGAGW